MIQKQDVEFLTSLEVFFLHHFFKKYNSIVSLFKVISFNCDYPCSMLCTNVTLSMQRETHLGASSTLHGCYYYNNIIIINIIIIILFKK